MSQRHSGYKRAARELYETPEWVTLALIPHLRPPRIKMIWEPAAGSGKMVAAFRKAGFAVYGTDANTGTDFLWKTKTRADAIFTNPPFIDSRRFIEHALLLMKPVNGRVAMLLSSDYDYAQTRQHLFGQCPAFAKKVNLTERIVWFEREGAAPSENHAWYIWDWRHTGPPELAYGP